MFVKKKLLVMVYKYISISQVGELGPRLTPYSLKANLFNMVVMLGNINTVMFLSILIQYKYMHLIMLT